MVTPGWVDMHTHYDAQATWDPELTPSGWHGVTTVVMGNCGVGFAPAAPDRHDWLIRLMEGVEDIPGAALTEGIQWEWEGYEGYLDALDRRRWVMDVGSQVPHGALRAYVMGDRGAANEPATADDLAAMERLARDALLAGGLGVSTSRTPLHRSADGELVPGTHADEAEIMALGDALRAAGHGVFQAALHHPDVPASFGWMRRARPALGPAGHVQPPADRRGPRPVARGRRRCSTRPPADGIEVYGQVHGRPVGVLMGWSATIHPFSAKPSWGQLAFLSPGDRVDAPAPARAEGRARRRASRSTSASSPRFLTTWLAQDVPLPGRDRLRAAARGVGRRHRRARRAGTRPRSPTTC